MSYFRFIPESPNWLPIKKRKKKKKHEARKELEKLGWLLRKEMPVEELDQNDVKEAQITGDFRDLFSSFCVQYEKKNSDTLFSCLVNILLYIQ